MTPIFGKGVVFDASPSAADAAQLRAARRQMKNHARTIGQEVRRAIETGRRGEIDLLDFFAELTIYTRRRA